MMVTASTQGLLFSAQPDAPRAVRMTASSQGRALRLAIGLLAARRDRLGDRDRAARHLGMHALDHAAVDLHHALVPVLLQVERRDHPARLLDFVRRRRARSIAWPDPGRM